MIIQFTKSHRSLVRVLAVWQAFAMLFTPAHMSIVYASNSQRVTTVESPLLARSQHTLTVLQDGRVLIAGGRDETGPLASTVVYNPSDGSVTVAGNMNAARTGHAATLLDDGRVLITGGSTSQQTLRSADVFNPATMSFAPVGPMTDARGGHTATKMVDGNVFIAGGNDIGSVEMFSPANNSFASAQGTMNSPRSGHTATLFSDNMILILGGGFASAEFFNATDGTFSLNHQSMSIARTGHDAIVTENNALLVLGGASPVVEQFDPATQSFSVRSTLSADVTTGTLLANERILALGLGQPTIVEPLTGLSEQVADAGTLQRTGHAAVELPIDKTILVTGGVNSSNQLVADGALFNPAWISTDLDDYPPGATVYVTGGGFKPGEEVQLEVSHLGFLHDLEGTHGETELDEFGQGVNFWTVQADEHGNLVDVTWLVCEQDCLGALLKLSAFGLTSGLVTGRSAVVKSAVFGPKWDHTVQ